MGAQNLVSATLTPEKKAEILKKIEEIEADLDFLIALQPDEVMGLFKANIGYQPFLDKAYLTVCAHPEIMSNVFDIEEFKRDYELSKDIAQILGRVKEVSEALQKTSIAVNSDAMMGGLEVYAAVKQNKDKVPGLEVMADEMGVFFQRTRRKAAQGKEG